MGWNVLHVKPRREKKVAEHCEQLKVEHYLPLRQETKVYQRRKVTVSKPVFPGYIFASFDDEGRVSLLKTNCLVRILPSPDESALVHELDQVRAALAVDPTLGATAAMRKGRTVRIVGGPFRGIEGRIDMLKGQTMVCLNVEMIGQAIRVEVDRSLVELAD
jgi:transcription antitermination factor NusG